MTHPTPWQLELHALGEEVPEVRAHLPCPVCEPQLSRMTTDPGPIPLILDGPGAPSSPSAEPGGVPWPLLAAAVSVVAVVSAVGVGLLATAPSSWTVPDASSPRRPAEIEPVERPRMPAPIQPAPAGPGQAETRRAEAVAPPELPMTAHHEQRAPVDLALVPPTGAGHVVNPRWSVDGTQLAFEVTDYRTDVRLFTWSGGRPQAVMLPGGGPRTRQVLTNPVWHPQGLVVFQGSLGAPPNDPARLYFSQPSTSTSAHEMISPQQLAGELVFPTISADGGRVAFVGPGGDRSRDLFLLDTATTQIRRVVASPEPELGPAFSPEGDVLYFSRRVGDSEDLFAVDPSTLREWPVRIAPGDQTRPAPGAEGAVAYFSQRDRAWDLEVIGPAGRRVLAEDIRLPMRAAPALSPDGAWVAFSHEDPQRSGDLMLARLDGSRVVAVPTGLLGVGEPALTSTATGLEVAFTALEPVGADWRGLYTLTVELE